MKNEISMIKQNFVCEVPKDPSWSDLYVKYIGRYVTCTVEQLHLSCPGCCVD